MVYCHLQVGKPEDRLTRGVKRVIENVVGKNYLGDAELVKVKKIKIPELTNKYRLIFKGSDEKDLVDWLLRTMPGLLDSDVGFVINSAYVMKDVSKK